MTNIDYNDEGSREHVLSHVRTIVIKVGTRLLTAMEAKGQHERVEWLIEQIAFLRAQGYRVILVSSGAIGAGMHVLNAQQRPQHLAELQAHAAVGQSRLMYLYETACKQYGFHCGQILLTAADVQSRERHLNTTACLKALLGQGVLPIINENDTVSVEEIRFGDNDILAALVATMLKAELTILLTTVDGLQETTEADSQGFGERISVVHRITPALRTMAAGTDGNHLSTGGMVTKLRAAEIVTTSGESLWVANGTDEHIVKHLLEGKDVGTLFMPARPERMKAHRRYLAFFAGTAGDIVIDAGAVKAITEKGSSLLPNGIVEVDGDFEKGQTVRIVDEERQEIARGITNYGSTDIARDIDSNPDSDDTEPSALTGATEAVHRDYMVLTTDA